jgi:adenylate cyclase class IV
MKFKEIETKYSAEEISYRDFKQFCQSRKPKNFVLASGYDHFYEKKNDPGSFCRHRVGPDMNQLTFKRKTVDSSNFVRTEHNLNLSPDTSTHQVEALCAEFDYQYNTSIFKTCFVYFYDWYVLSYYLCYDVHMKEVGRFVEIEMKEDHDFGSEENAWSSLLIIEKLCKEIGLNPKSRIKRSLFEIYKK